MRFLRSCLLVTLWLSTSTSIAAEPSVLRVSPTAVLLDRPEASQQLLVSMGSPQRPIDLTRTVNFRSLIPAIAAVDSTGRVQPRSEGKTEIVITHKERELRVPVDVQGLASPAPISFRHDVLPILSKAGCNSGGCHGKAEGQNGFKLSVFGFDADFDYAALVKEGRGRRVSVSAPESSLILLKGTAQMPHGGGRKIEPGSLWHRRLQRWIHEGAGFDKETSSPIAKIEVEPSQLLMSPKAQQQLRVTAVDAKGNKRCVTVEAEYQSNAAVIAGVDRDGLITVSDIPGDAAILVRYMGHVTTCRVTLPQPHAKFARPPEHNFIDKTVWNKLAELNVQPSDLCNDATFLRRAFLDTIGTLPTAAEAREFLADKSPDRRAKLVSRLLDRDEYADYWAMRWSDILRVDQSLVNPQGAVAMSRWIHRQFQQNTPYDQFARDIITARGNTQAESPAAFFQVHKDPEHAARAVSQIFLGVRIECAQCHHHPFERWSQKDYFALSGFFTSVALKAKQTGGGQKIYAKPGADLKHPRTQELVAAAGLGAAPADFGDQVDRRTALANWMTAKDNPFFARMIANRVWSHYFNRGLVEPIDDLRATNPATNEPLLDALEQHLIDVKFDLKAFTKTLLASRVYQLTSEPNASNQADNRNYSHAAWKPLPAEVLLDAICQATGVPEEFNGWPAGYRAIQVWDNRLPSYFFRVFGRPQRVSVCECERGTEPSIAQALHLMNSPESVHKIRHRDGRARALSSSNKSDEEIIDELFLATLSRHPSAKETALMRQAFTDSPENRRAAVEDILWTLLNTREFVYCR